MTLDDHARSTSWRPVVDRERVLTVLRKRFPDAPDVQVAAAANAIVGLDADWREIASFQDELLPHLTGESADVQCLAARLRAGGQFILFERVTEDEGQ